MRLGRSRRIDGLWVGVFGGRRDDQLLCKVEDALRLIKTCDAARYRRLLRDVDRIWIRVLPGPLGSFSAKFRRCCLDYRFVGAASTEAIASTIVHEAAHGHPWLIRFGYPEGLRHRIEQICMRQEMAFADRMPDGGRLRAQIRRDLARPAALWSTEAIAQRWTAGQLAAARFVGLPDWLTRSLLAIGRLWRSGEPRKPLAWPDARPNDKAVIRNDPDRKAVGEALTLWKTDPETALPRLHALADRGSVWSMLTLGISFTGYGADPDPGQAESWYRRAIEGGCQRALLNLGGIYESRGDFAGCEKLYGADWVRHWAPAMYRLAWVELQQPTTPARLDHVRLLLERAAEQADRRARMDLAHLMIRGRFGWRHIPRGFRLAWKARFKAAVRERLA